MTSDHQLSGLACSEGALSALVALFLEDEDHRRVILANLRASSAPGVAETVDRLSEAGDVEVILEPFLANAGNLDIAVVSRISNAILAIENKTGTTLGKDQITKYRVVLKDSDPRGDRAFATVLLRVGRPGSDPDAGR